MDKWIVEINGWEYTGWEYTGLAKITAKKVEKIGEDTIMADGIGIQFDEEIREPYIQEYELFLLFITNGNMKSTEITNEIINEYKF